MTIQRSRHKSYPGAQSQLRQLHLKASSADLVSNITQGFLRVYRAQMISIQADKQVISLPGAYIKDKSAHRGQLTCR